MARLFIAEKPELGRAIANGLSGTETKSNGYIKKGDDIITWAFGHILELFMPDDYDEKYKKWDMKDLPFDIKEFKYKPIEKSKAQLKIVLNLLKDKNITEVVHCGDADDEGQILVDEILQYANNKLPIKRLLINDLTQAGIKKGLKNIKSNDDFYGLSQRGFARSIADWIVGLNLTRACTLAANSKGYNGVLNLGRVQTPILSLVVNRDKENENFKSLVYYGIKGNFKSFDGIEFYANLKVDEKITSEESAQNIAKECENQTARIITKRTENKKEQPPLPYNLLKLQSECAKKLGLKPDRVLSITQNLREKFHLITYNRSDCEYLPDTMYDESPAIINSLREIFANTMDIELQGILDNANFDIKSRAFNSENISAHHAIIPTGAKVNLNELSKDELEIFTLIVKRFVLQFFKAREYEATNVIIELGEYQFSASQNTTTNLGFTFYLKPENHEKNDDEGNEVENTSKLSDLIEGSTADCQSINIEAKETKPKPYYTMSTLLNDLTGVAKYAKDPNIKKLLLEKDSGKKGENGGIGTPATRSNHIKNLIDNEFISVSNDKKQIIHATQKGKDLIAIAPEILTCVDMTALWFEKQKMIESRDLSLDDFLAEINEQMKVEISKLKDKDMGNFATTPQNATTCPVCNKGYLIRRESQNKKGVFWWGCSNYANGCKAIFYDDNGKPKLEDKQKQEIPSDAKICPKCKNGKLLAKTSAKGFNYFACNGKLKNGNWCNAKFKTNQNGELEEMIFGKK